MAAVGAKRTSDDGHSIYSAGPAVLDWLKGTGRSRYGGFLGTFDICEIFGTARFSTFSTASVICRHRWASCPCSPYLESRHRPGCMPADMTQTEFFVARYIAPAGPICFRRTYLRFGRARLHEQAPQIRFMVLSPTTRRSILLIRSERSASAALMAAIVCRNVLTFDPSDTIPPSTTAIDPMAAI
jgi:hypothetical protein